MKGQGVCDFCSSPAIVRSYYCHNFISDSEMVGVIYKGYGVTLNSVREWAACAECARLIDMNDLEGLVNYALAAQKIICQMERIPTELIKHVRYTYELFFLNRMV